MAGEFAVAARLVEVRRRHLPQDVDLAATVELLGHLFVAHEAETDAIEVRLFAPIVGIALDHQLLALTPGDEVERTGADRRARGVGAPQILALVQVLGKDAEVRQRLPQKRRRDE